jgi:hypothetical protein
LQVLFCPYGAKKNLLKEKYHAAAGYKHLIEEVNEPQKERGVRQLAHAASKEQCQRRME